MKVWMARTENGQFLCEGNVNDGLSYHLGFPHNARYMMDSFVMRDRKFEIAEDCRKWRKECVNRWGKVLGGIKPIRVEITWEGV